MVSGLFSAKTVVHLSTTPATASFEHAVAVCTETPALNTSATALIARRVCIISSLISSATSPISARFPCFGADTGGGHQAPAHLIIPDNGQQTAMQDDDLFANDPPDNEHRLDQHRQVGEVLNKLPDAGLKLHLPNHANLETEVAQSAAQVILDCDRLRL